MTCWPVSGSASTWVLPIWVISVKSPEGRFALAGPTRRRMFLWRLIQAQATLCTGYSPAITERALAASGVSITLMIGSPVTGTSMLAL
jgi:hypothetical protein